MSSGNKSIFDYFSKASPAEKVLSRAEPTPHTKWVRTKAVPHPPTQHTGIGQSNLAVSKTLKPPEYTSSLSPPPPTPSSDADSLPGSREPTPQPVASSNEASGRIINSTDDEDSDSSLEDLENILATNRAVPRPMTSLTTAPKTPNAPRHMKTDFNFHTSPLTFHSKYEFDMKSLMSHAQKDDAVEASSKRVKAMMAPKIEKEHVYLASQDEDSRKANLGALLESVASEQEGGIAKVNRALMRTEATIPEKRWYFFDTQAKPMRAPANPFPKGSALKGWEGEFQDPQMRRQSFAFGFVEDMVRLGKRLPDELFLWLLDEAFLESHDSLRSSYLNVLEECSEQCERIILPEVVQSLFRKLGATASASTTTHTIKPVLMLSTPYPNHNWTRICSGISFLGKIGAFLKPNSRTHTICMILRMSVDRAVVENVDLLATVLKAIYYLCRDIPETEWESTCSDICKTLMKTVQQSTFRLQMVNSIPPGSRRTHDLMRRLAMCFFFNDLSYSMSHPHLTMDIERFIDRLGHSDFDARPSADYLELKALILLLDVAVDDGQSAELDLTDPEVEKGFNQDVDSLVASIKDVMTSIGNPGAAFISRIEAKEALELISQRIADTVRTKKVVKESWFDRNRSNREENMESEKEGMSNFVVRVNQVKKEVNGSGAT